MAGHDLLDVLEPVDRDALQALRERACQKRAQLDEHEAQMLTGTPIDSAALGPATLRKYSVEIRQRTVTSAPQERIGDVPDAPAYPGRHRQGQSPHGSRHAGHGAADDRRRSLRISIAIGTSDSTMTTITRRWRCRPIFGTVWPSRYPAHVMLSTHPTPPTTL